LGIRIATAAKGIKSVRGGQDPRRLDKRLAEAG
jgi:hypothetical protein